MPDTRLTTTQAATALGVTRQRVRVLILAGRLPAVKLGRDWMIEPAALAAVAVRPNGYPKGRPRVPIKRQPVDLGRR